MVPTAATAVPDSIEDRFLRFDAANPGIYAHFVAEARMDLKLQFAANKKRHREGGMGVRARLSAKRIGEKLRNNPGIVTKGEGFKLNNDFFACYARKAMAEHADLTGYFELRRRKNES